jgi:hypothetical protein
VTTAALYRSVGIDARVAQVSTGESARAKDGISIAATTANVTEMQIETDRFTATDSLHGYVGTSTNLRGRISMLPACSSRRLLRQRGYGKRATTGPSDQRPHAPNRLLIITDHLAGISALAFIRRRMAQ